MMKTKLGISAELFGAALYFIGLISIIPLVLMAGYVLIVEDNDWLKKTAVKAVAVVIFFAILSSVVGLVGNSTSLLSDIASLFKGTINLSWLNRFLSICRTAISLVQALFLLLLGLKALKQGDVKLGSVDKVIEKNM
jgi:hypothetical protein